MEGLSNDGYLVLRSFFLRRHMMLSIETNPIDNQLVVFLG